MDFSDKSSFSLSPSGRSATATPKASPSDENDPSNRKMGSGRQSPNKAKFSSPPKPGVSKAFASRKKVLAERNEASDSIFSTTEKPQKIATFANSEASDEDEQNGFVADSSSQPYDPLTNYLSPRPKFLRYQPNRCRQILLSLEKDGSDSSRSSSFDPHTAVGEEGSWEEEIDDDEIEEEEEEEEERGNWVLRGLLKSFILFVVLALCTSYISSFNSQTPALQTEWDMKDGFERIQDMITEAVKNLEGSEVEEMFGDSDVLWVSKDATMAVEDEEKVTIYSLGDVMKEEELEEGAIGDVDDSSENEEANVAQDSELLDRETEEIMDSFQDHETLVVMSYDGGNIVSDASLDVSGAEVEIVMKQEASNKEEARDEEEVGETEMKKRIENFVAGVFVDVKERCLESELSILIGAAIGFSLIVASLVMGCLHLNKKRRADTEKDGSMIKDCPEPEAAEKHSSAVALHHPMEEKKEEQIVQVGSSKKVSQSIQSTMEGNLMNQRNAPRIQMLSEFVVSSNSVSMRSCSTKNRGGIEEDEKKSVSSNYSGSVPVRSRSEMSEFSSKNNSESHISFTAERKMVRKTSGGGKENTEVATPVRRSSRIQSRCITSP